MRSETLQRFAALADFLTECARNCATDAASRKLADRAGLDGARDAYNFSAKEIRDIIRSVEGR